MLVISSIIMLTYTLHVVNLFYAFMNLCAINDKSDNASVLIVVVDAEDVPDGEDVTSMSESSFPNLIYVGVLHLPATVKPVVKSRAASLISSLSHISSFIIAF